MTEEEYYHQGYYPVMGIVTCEICGCMIELRPIAPEGSKSFIRIHWERFHNDEILWDKYRRDCLGDCMFEGQESARHRYKHDHNMEE